MESTIRIESTARPIETGFTHGLSASALLQRARATEKLFFTNEKLSLREERWSRAIMPPSPLRREQRAAEKRNARNVFRT